VKEPTIAITDFALTRIEQVRANRKQPEAGVRIAITGRQAGAFTYDLSLVNPGDERDGEMVVDGPSGVRFTMPVASAQYLDGVTIDADRARGALTVDNPNPSGSTTLLATCSNSWMTRSTVGCQPRRVHRSARRQRRRRLHPHGRRLPGLRDGRGHLGAGRARGDP